MKELGPKMLRAYAKALEDKRQLANVENCQRCPELDQHMLLAVNGATGEESDYKDGFPDAGVVIGWMKKRLIKVSTPDNQGAKLGLFYTNIDPMNRKWPRVAVGVFPLYHKEVKYTFRPCDPLDLHKNGEIQLRKESISKKEPMLIFPSKGPDLLFFRTSPFVSGHPYKLPPEKVKDIRNSYSQEPYGLGLEENVIERALWELKVQRLWPGLFRQPGFATFINSHCSDPRYMELQVAFTRFQHRKRSKQR